MTHGEMAFGMYHTAAMLLGEQNDFDYLSFRPDQSLDSLIEDLKVKLDGFHNEKPNLVLVDLFGGSPSNAIVYLLAEGYQLQAVAGVNLPMLIAALTERDLYPSAEVLAEHVRTAGSDGTVNIAARLMEEQEETG